MNNNVECRQIQHQSFLHVSHFKSEVPMWTIVLKAGSKV